jgi:hypothetical protein
MTQFLARRYGASGLHLIAHAAAFAVAAYAIAQILSGGRVVNFIIWFAGAALLHDIVFLPLYSLLDRLAGRGAHELKLRTGVPVINHLRAPTLISGLLLLVYFPLILGTSDHNYFSATGHHPEGYARNWLLITAVLFLGSALIYAARLRARSAPARRHSPSKRAHPPSPR